MCVLGAWTHDEIELYLLMLLVLMRALAKWANLD